jgi:glycine C-acetyltransferase
VTAAVRFATRADEALAAIARSGQTKVLRPLAGAIGPTAVVESREVVVMCSNDYLGLASEPSVVASGIAGLRRYGAGTASVRFICGTVAAHVELEAAIAGLVGSEAALSFGSCWAANEALLPTVAAPGDTILSDELNHASIIDAGRLARGAARVVYRHNDVDHLRRRLAAASSTGLRWVVTDGVFSMEGDVAPLRDIAAACRDHEALLVVDDSHGIGVLGQHGRGTPEHAGLIGQVDVLTGTLGKALGGAAGGYVAGSRRLIELLTQRGRPSLFSNALPATVACSARRAIELLTDDRTRVGRLAQTAASLRTGLRELGYDCPDGPSAIIPIVLGEAAAAENAAQRLFELGVLAVAFSHPVVPEGRARVRLQASAGHRDEHVEAVLAAFARL